MRHEPGSGVGKAPAGRTGWLGLALALAAAIGAAAPAAAQDVDVDLGTLPAGKRVRVLFDATVDSPPSGPLVMTVENQGTVSSNTSAFGAIVTDDPDEPASRVDPTRTTLDGLAVGNLVWRDDNGNNVFDGSPTDTPLVGVTVNLYLDDGDGVLDAGDGAPIATDVTAAGGIYGFGGLQPGDYVVEVAACNFTGLGCSAALAGLGSIGPVPAADPDDDIDNDDNGDVVAGFGVAAKAVTLAFNDEPPAAPATLPDGDADTDTNLTIDFGFAPVADLEIVKKTHSPDPVVAGTNITYTIEFRNNGPGSASTVTVTDPTPTNTTFVSATPAAGWTPTAPAVGGTGNVTFSKASVAASETATFSITVQVDPAVASGSTITNTATAASASFDPNTANNSKMAATGVQTRADLEMTGKSDAPDPVNAGAQLTYTLTFENDGPSNAQTVTVSDTLPANTTFVSAAVTVGTGWTPTTPAVGSGGTVQFAKAAVAAAETATFQIVVEVDSSVADGATIANTATASSATTDPGPGANSAMASTTVQARADMSLTKVDDVDPQVPGGTVVYTLTASNAGPSDAQNVEVTDTLPAGLSFVSTSGCDNDPNGFPTCELGTVAAGGMKAYTLAVTVDSPAAAGVTSLTNNATVATTTTETSVANQDASEATGINAAPDLTIDKSDGDTTSFPGGVIAYTLTFDNVGDQGATGVKIVETVPADTTFNEAASGGAGVWSCADGAPPPTVCEHLAGALAGGGAGPSTVTFAVTVDPGVVLGTTREISNTATIQDDGANGVDPDTADNSSTDTTPLPVDFGDAPDPLDATAGLYPTLLANDGARHAIRPVGDPLRIFLGSAVDDDSDGQPSPPLTPAAAGDDTDGDGDDEDGVTFLSGLRPGASTSVDVTASAAGVLNAWVDFDVDGVFAPGEQVFTNRPLVAGVNSLSFATPAGALTGPTADLLEGSFARFRFASAGGLGPSGQATDGEVEDYFVEILREADLGVTLSDTVDPIVAGDIQIYDIAVTNGGPAQATGVKLQHELPPGGLFLGAEPSSADCRLLSGMLVECDLGTLAVGAAIDLRIGVLIDHRLDGIGSSEALVAGNELDPDSSNDEADADTTVVAAREMVSTTRAGVKTLAMIAKEGDSTVGLVFADAAGGGNREYSVEALGFRATSLTEVPSFGDSASPEIAALAAGFGGGTKVIVVDADSQALLGDHDVAGSWLAIDIVSLASFAGGPAPELALLLRDPAGAELRVRVIDAASGAPVRDHVVATSTPDPPNPDIVAPFPVGMVAVPSFDGTARPELAILTKNPDTEEVRVLVADADSGIVVRDHGQGTDLFPLGIVGLPDLGLGGGTVAADVAILLRRASTDDLHVLVLDASNGTPFGPIDFDDTLLPGPLVSLPSFAGGAAPELAVLGREDPTALTVDIKDAATGSALSSIAVGSPPKVPVPLGLASFPSFGGGAAPEVAVLFEFFGEPTQVSVFDAAGAGPLFHFFLP